MYRILFGYSVIRFFGCSVILFFRSSVLRFFGSSVLCASCAKGLPSSNSSLPWVSSPFSRVSSSLRSIRPNSLPMPATACGLTTSIVFFPPSTSVSSTKMEILPRAGSRRACRKRKSVGTSHFAIMMAAVPFLSVQTFAMNWRLT